MTQSEFLQKQAELRSQRREIANRYEVLNRNAVKLHFDKVNQERDRYQQELVKLGNERRMLMENITREETNLRVAYAKSQEREAVSNQTTEE